MALPLQPDPRPAPAWWRRLMLLTGLLAMVLALGLASTQRRRPDELVLTTPGRAADYPRVLDRLIRSAQREITIAMFVVRSDPGGPVEAVITALGEAVRRGVVVRFVLDRGRDRQTGLEETKHEPALTQLRKLGVDARTDDLESTLHAKCVIVDGRWVLMGSHNWTLSAWSLNREASVLIDDPALARTLSDRLLTGQVPGLPAAIR